MVLTLAQLRQAMPDVGTQAGIFLPWINFAMQESGISLAEPRAEMFLATIAHESGDLQHVSENLNYSAAGLCKTWPKRFPTLQSALPYNRNPVAIANKVYANRGGNGDEKSGDGWRYRGAGLIQLTFKDNQAACAKHFGIPVEKVGDWLRTPEGACRSAAWFWKKHGCNELADKNDFDGVCDVVNLGRKTATIGDSIGYAARVDALKHARAAV